MRNVGNSAVPVVVAMATRMAQTLQTRMANYYVILNSMLFIEIRETMLTSMRSAFNQLLNIYSIKLQNSQISSIFLLCSELAENLGHRQAATLDPEPPKLHGW